MARGAVIPRPQEEYVPARPWKVGEKGASPNR
ncbi:MAG: hypothetical protein RBG13Loki_1599, partial [Promethearchaeota archaeon CR_4]